MKTYAVLPFQAARSLLVASCMLLAPGLAAGQSPVAEGATGEVLSVGWQAGYCAARPKSRTCAGFSPTADAAQIFSLLGRFQPRKSYCGVEAGLVEKARKGPLSELPGITLDAGTKVRLVAAMPVGRDGFERRQWLRSGTCIAGSANDYFTRSLDLLDQLNASQAASVFAGKAGGAITLGEVRAAFDTAFGTGAGERVRLACRKNGEETFVTGLTIGIAAGDGTLAAAIQGARPTQSRCAGGKTGRVKAAHAAL